MTHGGVSCENEIHTSDIEITSLKPKQQSAAVFDLLGRSGDSANIRVIIVLVLGNIHNARIIIAVIVRARIVHSSVILPFISPHVNVRQVIEKMVSHFPVDLHCNGLPFGSLADFRFFLILQQLRSNNNFLWLFGGSLGGCSLFGLGVAMSVGRIIILMVWKSDFALLLGALASRRRRATLKSDGVFVTLVLFALSGPLGHCFNLVG